MRSTNELKVILAQVELLEERKTDIETFVLEINAVIARCKSWMEEKEDNKTSLSELLVLCAKIADQQQENVVGHNQITDKAQPYCSSDLSNTATNIKENESKKLVLRLEVLEFAFSSLKTTNQINENSFSGLKECVDKFTETTNKRFQQLEEKTELYSKEQSEELKTMKKEINKQKKNVQSINKTVQEIGEQTKKQNEELAHEISFFNDAIKEQSEQWTIINNEIDTEMKSFQSLKTNVQAIEEKCQEHYEELVHDISSCNDDVRSLQSNYSGMSHDMETVTNRCKDVDSDVISLKSSLQTLSTSCDSFRSSTELVEQEQRTQTEQLQTKVQTLQEQIVTLDLEIKSISKMKDKAAIGFLASNSRRENTIEFLLTETQSYDSSRLNESHEKNTKLVLKFFKYILYNTECDFDSNTGILKVRHDGLYLIYTNADHYRNEHIYLGHVIRNNNKIAWLYPYKRLKFHENSTQLVTILYLKRGNEICIYSDEILLTGTFIDDFGCILIN